MTQKPDKPAEFVESYRPINLLPVLSKIFKNLLPGLSVIMERQKIIPNYQFGFQHKHAPIEQIHRIVKRKNINMDADRYCTAPFLDISQALGKIWHAAIPCVLHEIKSCFPSDLYAIIKSYLIQRTFRVKYEEAVTQLKDIKSGVLQSSVLEPVTLFAIHGISSTRLGYHNCNCTCNLCGRHSYPGDL